MRLTVSLGSLPIVALPLREGRTRIGKSPGNDIVLSLPEIADEHAEILHTRGRITIHALGAEHLLVGGSETARADLAPGATVICGPYELRVEGDAERGGPASNAGAVRETSTLPMLGRREVQAPVAAVQVVAGPDQGAVIELGAAPLVLGRSPDAGLVLHDETVSWRHLVLERAGRSARVRDLGSRNGTYLDGRLVEAAPAGGSARVRIGRTELILLETARAAPAPDEVRGLAELVGMSKPMRALYRRIQEASAVVLPTLLLGETGAGKDLAARAIHALGPRAGGPFVPVNCAAIPRDLLESELFGYAKGAFSGALADHDGALVRAHEGTLFLDEIGDLAPELQAKLLRAVETGDVPRLGGAPVKSDFRLLSATQRPLREEAEAGRFRADLFYRLAVLEVRLPALRARTDDIPDLVHAFLEEAPRVLGIAAKDVPAIDEDALPVLVAHDWPGNVRELRNVIHRAVLTCRAGVIDAGSLTPLLAEARQSRNFRAGTLEDAEREAIANALRDCNGQRRAAARRLGMGESTLYVKIRRYGLEHLGRPPRPS